jgi:hypothetical protein
MQQREYGSVPSFARTQRIAQSGQATENSDSSSAAYTILDEGHSSIYMILPTDFNAENLLGQLKLKLEQLHPSQRDYVAAQLMHEVCSYTLYLI